MAVRYVGEALQEAAALMVYGACSVAGRFIQPGHRRRGRRRAVLLVPGFLGRGLAFLRLRKALAGAGHPVYVADLGYGVGCLKEKARELEALVDAHRLDDFIVVGHSMGGLIALGMDDDYRRRVHHFVTLGTTFRGAMLSHLVPLLPAARQLRRDSSWGHKVRRRARGQANLTSVIAAWDEIILSSRACWLAGMDVRPGVAGHARLILDGRAVASVVDLVGELE